MFEYLFKYAPAVFAKGDFVFLSGWPVWLLAAAVMLAAGALLWPLRAHLSGAGQFGRARAAGVWSLQAAMAASILVLLWRPALSVATLKPQQNIVAVIVDDSRSMALAEPGGSRRDQAVKVLEGGLLETLGRRFQVRLYRAGEHLSRIGKPGELQASARATRIGDSLEEAMAESSTLPIGSIVLLSDGADNSGGISLETMTGLRRRRIPIHTVGFGRERFERDIEISDVQAPARALADSRLSARVALRQQGYGGGKTRLSLRDGNKVLASREIELAGGGREQVETLVFNAGAAGARNLSVSVDPLPGEENAGNNTVSRLVNVEASKPRVLYIEGEPRWEFKFIRRALEEDRSVQLSTILRTTQNKVYRQGVSGPKELEQGFPTTVEELFNFQGIVIGGVEAGYFSARQQELIAQFVDRRGGGVLFLAGREGLADGGYAQSPLAALLPVTLPSRKATFQRDPAAVELTPAGRESLICRIEEDAGRNAERWKKLPYLANFQDAGVPKPGAVVLADLLPSGRGRLPLLVSENYGRGRTAVLATAGTWRWQMSQELADRSHEMFWQQLLRWLVSGTPGRVLASTPRPVLSDETRVRLRAEVRDTTYLPHPSARVEARILAPGGAAGKLELAPDPLDPGVFTAEWTAEKPGAYVAEVVAMNGGEETGRDVLMFHREDGVAENFRAEQNRELLEKLASETGGRYWRPSNLERLAEEVAYSEAGISVRETKELWNMPAVFLALLALRAGEWLLRRKWGAV